MLLRSHRGRTGESSCGVDRIQSRESLPEGMDRYPFRIVPEVVPVNERHDVAQLPCHHDFPPLHDEGGPAPVEKRLKPEVDQFSTFLLKFNR